MYGEVFQLQIEDELPNHRDREQKSPRTEPKRDGPELACFFFAGHTRDTCPPTRADCPERGVSREEASNRFRIGPQLCILGGHLRQDCASVTITKTCRWNASSEIAKAWITLTTRRI